jgi:SNF2 family DNA or RNA helicase
LKQALLRKRDIKGGYKARLALEKLVIDHERKRA